MVLLTVCMTQMGQQRPRRWTAACMCDGADTVQPNHCAESWQHSCMTRCAPSMLETAQVCSQGHPAKWPSSMRVYLRVRVSVRCMCMCVIGGPHRACKRLPDVEHAVQRTRHRYAADSNKYTVAAAPSSRGRIAAARSSRASNLSATVPERDQECSSTQPCHESSESYPHAVSHTRGTAGCCCCGRRCCQHTPRPMNQYRAAQPCNCALQHL
jgi:hypothetical protein